MKRARRRVVNDKTVNDHRKHANHVFYGPGYSIAHPGVFPFNKDATALVDARLAAVRLPRGWGTEEFEEGG